jgi:rod shape-determining protein MreB and related proteins
MGLSYFNQALAMDLGTANTIIFRNDEIVLDEPSIVAIDNDSGKCVAIGQQAKLMHGRENRSIKTVKPLKGGVIANFNAAEMMISGFIKKVNGRRGSMFSPNLKMVFGIPSGSTEVEIRAVRDSSEHIGGRDVFLIYEPMAAALGIGLDIESHQGNMIIDIGGGTTEIAVISLGGLVVYDSIRVAGDVFNADIQQYMREQHHLKVGDLTAEQIKHTVGSVCVELEDAPEPMSVTGLNIMTGHPMEIKVSCQDVAHALDKSVNKIENSILHVLERTPPELYTDIVKNCIYLSGGGALLRGLASRLSKKVNIPFHIADDPIHAVARGTAIALKNTDRYSCLMR